MRDLLIAKRYNFDSYISQGGPSQGGAARMSKNPNHLLRDKSASITADNLIIGAIEVAFQNMVSNLQSYMEEYTQDRA